MLFRSSIRILTIHKAKGLQFPVVLMPFCEWTFNPSKDSILWARTDEEPFAAFGELPLPSVAALDKTVFRQSYAEEKMHALTDNINLLYVAFTRAEQQLIAWCPPAAEKGLAKCSAFISRILEANETLKTRYPSGSNEFTLGDPLLQQVAKRSSSKVTIRTRTDFTKAAWQEKLTIAAHAREFTEEADTRKSAVSRGILVHKILAQTADVTTLENTMSKFLFEGLLEADEMEPLTEAIGRIMNNKTVKDFFLPGKKVLAERDILLPDGEVFRPDRVLLEDHLVTVVDFKTGQENESHRKQLAEYSEILLRMQNLPVHAYLVYLKTGTVQQVELPLPVSKK